MIFSILVAFLLCPGANGQAVVLPLTDDLRSELRTQLNTLRRSVTSSNMETLTEWSADLEQIAEDLGSQCQSTISHTQYGVGTVAATSPANVYSALQTIKADYTLTGNKCGTVSTEDCNTYKQFVWYRGGKFGCAMVYCTALGTSRTTCVFEQKMDPNQKPYVYGKKCIFCATGKCEGNLCTADVSSSTHDSSGVCGVKPSNLIPLYRAVHTSRSDTILSTSSSLITAPGTSYEYKGILGYISSSCECCGDCDKLTPLMKLSAVGKVDYVYAVGKDQLTYYNQKNYNFVEMLGYVVPAEGFCGANVTVHQFIRSAAWNYYTADEVETKNILQRKGIYAAFSYVDKPFAIWSSA
uniref:SCP domain-containing protein n=1 Tax=Trichuris muris TaxID=70415 RepID=A0A5S6QW63_TRIMR